jgi:hypothetical protein
MTSREAAECDLCSVRSVAAATVSSEYAARTLKPAPSQTFKVSRGKNFAAKVEDVVGLS